MSSLVPSGEHEIKLTVTIDGAKYGLLESFAKPGVFVNHEAYYSRTANFMSEQIARTIYYHLTGNMGDADAASEKD